MTALAKNMSMRLSASMALDVPLLPDETYIDFINGQHAHIAACHFSLYAPDVAPFAGLIKICGRTLGHRFLMTAIQAYLQEGYTGNLFDVLDACHWMAATVDLPNHGLPRDFWRQVTACRKACRSCEVCRAIWTQTAHRREFSIMPCR
jgi:hypothetical protein